MRSQTRFQSRRLGVPRWRTGWLATALTLLLGVAAADAQEATSPSQPDPPSRIVTTANLLAGVATGLVLHESGHLTFDWVLGTEPGLKRVSYAGIPFFAITHQPVTPVKEFAISSAGFWTQHATSEILLSRRPRLRYERAPFAKGVLAFNVLVSVMYAGAAVARTGPDERDTRGIAAAAGIEEPWVAPIILAPALFDTVRYFKPESPTAKWLSRAAKVGGVLLVLKARS